MKSSLRRFAGLTTGRKVLFINLGIFVVLLLIYFFLNENSSSRGDFHLPTSAEQRYRSLTQNLPPRRDCAESRAEVNKLRQQVSDLQFNLSLAQRTLQQIHSAKNKPKLGQSASKLGDDLDQSADYQVPNLVHYIWYAEETKHLEFHHMLSILSAHRYINPDLIYFHTNRAPTGKYWDRVRRLPRFKINLREPPVHVLGENVTKPRFYTSHSNVDRVLVLMEFGGIYLDLDYIALRSFNELRKHVCTIGLESNEKACGSVVICSKQSFFLRLWINAYFDDYQMDEWAYNTGQVPFNLARRFPDLVHVEPMRLNRPNFLELDQIWEKATWWKWKENYGFHSWYRLWKTNYGGNYDGVEPDESNVKTMNNTFAEIARSILYPSKLH